MSNLCCDEQIVMTPTKRNHGHMTITMERVKVKEIDNRNVMHVAGGDHTGIVITKDSGHAQYSSSQPELYLGFRVMLRSASNNRKEQEDWLLKFWFKSEVPESERIENAQAFCTELLAHEGFPKDSVDFIKRNMKLMQLKYPTIQKVEVEMKKLDDNFKQQSVNSEAAIPNANSHKYEDIPSPCQVQERVVHEYLPTYCEQKQAVYENSSPSYVQKPLIHEDLPPTPIQKQVVREKSPDSHVQKQVVREKVPPPCAQKRVSNEKPVLTHVQEVIPKKLSPLEEKLLDIVEAVYPNSLSLTAVAKSFEGTEEEIFPYLLALEENGFLKRLKNGNFMRITGSDADVKMVKQLPMMPPAMQPVIAIITANYCEKLAVDTMIDNKETFVKFKTEGESNVFTLGSIGAHRVVATKLPAVGHARGPMIAAGSTTTRLLGSFGRVEYVFLVGVGGGVAHYTDYTKHVRLGDVVISSPPDAKRSYIYMYCEKQSSASDSCEDLTSFEQLSIKTWCPPSMQLQQTALNLWQKGLGNPRAREWERYLSQSLKMLQSKELSFCRPSADTDKLYMSLGENNLMEVGHPQPSEGSYDPRTPGMPVLHFGAVGSGRVLMHDDTTRLEFADRHGILAFDTEFDSVAESIYGNRKDHYMFIRGIADYKDGTKKKEWQPYAALAAAAVMKAIICNLEPCD